MKVFSMFCALALLALGNMALANDFVNFQDDAVVGEDLPPPPDAAAPEGAPVESYGYAPGFSGGCCCDDAHGHSHLWENYCAEKHCGWGLGHGCCKAFAGCGPFSKGCCEPKCGKCRRWHLPRLHMPKICLPKLHLKDRCCHQARCCKEPVCHKAKCCRKLHLPKLRLFSRNGCCSKGCKGASEVIYEGPAEVNEVPVPAMDVNEVPMPPMDTAA